MKKLYKRFIASVLVGCMIMSASGGALAVSNDEPLLDNVVLVENGTPRQITQSELNELNARAIYEADQDNLGTVNSQVNDGVMPNGAADLFLDVTSYDPQVYYGQSKPVSAYIMTGTAGGSISVVNSMTFTRSYSISTTSALEGAVSATIGAAFSVSNSEQIGYTLNIGANKKARVMFAPICKAYRGTYKKYGFSGELLRSEQVTVYQPQKVGRYADGVYWLEEK